MLDVEFSGALVEWRGPAPHIFLPTPAEVTDDIAAVAGMASYGWGCIPARVTLGETTYTTSLFPREGGYMVPVKVAVRRREGVDEGDTVTVRLQINPL